MSDDWPRVVDLDSAAKRIQRLERSRRADRTVLLLTTIALAVLAIVGFAVIQWTAEDRQRRFCALTFAYLAERERDPELSQYLEGLYRQSRCTPPLEGD